jgi:hypothetical protein
MTAVWSPEGGTVASAFGAAAAEPSMTTRMNSAAVSFDACGTAAPNAAAVHPLWLLQLPAMHETHHSWHAHRPVQHFIAA